MNRRLNGRKYLRLRIKVEIPANGNPISAYMLDISRGGAFIELPSLLRASTPLIVEFRLPDSRPQHIFRLFAKVVHRSPEGIGVAFLKMPAATSQALGIALSMLPGREEQSSGAEDESESEPTQGFAAVWVV